MTRLIEDPWLPNVAGILDIISGCIGLIIAFAIFYSGLDLFSAAVASPFAIVGILAIVGGICALGKIIWGLALAGSIGALILCWFLGIAAIILTAKTKKQFGRAQSLAI
jgi:hypothetical protein